MKFLLQILVVMVLAFLLEVFLPWWAVAIAGALAGVLVSGSAGRAFFAGFIGVFVLWTFAATSLMQANGEVLADRIGALLPGTPPGAGVAVISGVVGGLVAAFGGATGARLRSSFGRSAKG
jgi:hypothetical protein